ncbi:hypothetical protein HYFRA_00002222 [Hymenoscyphus fraxineus]|uniref:Uncharacterized protein n=1 Tax=Hymenoscyphus fraxineus TaxID=746836 RepID=A0A9N9KLX1_9HELO|nr:hypothetical protein HYFRA_00002222 [Hymenoscyphus fraxineus]
MAQCLSGRWLCGWMTQNGILFRGAGCGAANYLEPPRLRATGDAYELKLIEDCVSVVSAEKDVLQ